MSKSNRRSAANSIYEAAGVWNEHWGRLKVVGTWLVGASSLTVLIGGFLIHRYGTVGAVFIVVGSVFLVASIVAVVVARRQSSTPFEELKLRRAAEQGHAQAALELSRLIRGDDPGEADTWLKKSAALGNAAAMNELAILLSERGESDRAREWWLKSSELGNSDAAYRLGSSLPKIAQGPLPGPEDKPKTDYWTLSKSLTEGYEHRDAARHAGDRSALNEACSGFSTWALSVNKWMQINHPALFATLPQTAPWALQGKGKAVDLMDAYLNALAKVARRLEGYE